MIKHILPLLISIIFTSCWSVEWTENERNDFSDNCSKKILFDTKPICFTGFDYSEIDSILVIEKEGNEIKDSLFIYLNNTRSKHDIRYDKFWGSPIVKFNVNHSYDFILDGDKPYILNNMEMIMWAQYTMGGEDWGCQMGNFTIDSEKFEHIGNIYFTKREFKHK